MLQNYSREEAIQGQKLYKEVQYIRTRFLLKPILWQNCKPFNTQMILLMSNFWKNLPKISTKRPDIWNKLSIFSLARFNKALEIFHNHFSIDATWHLLASISLTLLPFHELYYLTSKSNLICGDVWRLKRRKVTFHWTTIEGPSEYTLPWRATLHSSYLNIYISRKIRLCVVVGPWPNGLKVPTALYSASCLTIRLNLHSHALCTIAV